MNTRPAPRKATPQDQDPPTEPRSPWAETLGLTGSVVNPRFMMNLWFIAVTVGLYLLGGQLNKTNDRLIEYRQSIDRIVKAQGRVILGMDDHSLFGKNDLLEDGCFQLDNTTKYCWELVEKPVTPGEVKPASSFWR